MGLKNKNNCILLYYMCGSTGLESHFSNRLFSYLQKYKLWRTHAWQEPCTITRIKFTGFYQALGTVVSYSTKAAVLTSFFEASSTLALMHLASGLFCFFNGDLLQSSHFHFDYNRRSRSPNVFFCERNPNR